MTYARIFTQARVIAWNYGYTCAAIALMTPATSSRFAGAVGRPRDTKSRPAREADIDRSRVVCASGDGEADVLKAKRRFQVTCRMGASRAASFFAGPYVRRWVDIGITPCAAAPAEPPAVEAGGEQTVQKTITAHGVTVHAGYPIVKLVERIGSQLAQVNDMEAAQAKGKP
jgi:hypothetical protein